MFDQFFQNNQNQQHQQQHHNQNDFANQFFQHFFGNDSQNFRFNVGQQHQEQQQRQPQKNLTKEEQSQQEAEDFKAQGNNYLNSGKYQEAINCYTKAIKKNSKKSIYYSNRAHAYKLINKLDKAMKDATTAMKIDNQNIKAIVILAKCEAELGKKHKKNDFINQSLDHFRLALAICKDKKFELTESEVLTYYYRALKVLTFRQIKGKIYHLKNFLKTLNKIHETLSKKNSKIKNDTQLFKIQQQISEKISKLSSIEKIEAPQEYQCQITLELMKNPYITQTGHSYEKESLMEHLKNCGFDPLTRQAISSQKIYCNKQLKQAIREYIEKNPFVFEQENNSKILETKF